MASTYHVGELLQTLGTERQTGMLAITKDLVLGNIFLEEGRLVHAECNQGKMGQPALHLLLSMEKALCEWHVEITPITQTLDNNVEQSLIDYLISTDGRADTNGIEEPADELPDPPTKTAIVDFKNCAVALTIQTGAMEGGVYYLTKRESRIGRALGSDIIIPETSVSSHHCKLTLDRYVLKARDLGSTNGTEVNGERITQAVIQAGDTLCIGGVKISIAFRMRRSSRITQAIPKNFTTSLHEQNANKETAPLPDLQNKEENQVISRRDVLPKDHHHEDNATSSLDEIIKKLF